MTFFYVSLQAMKEKLLILCLFSFFATMLVAQQPHIIVPDSSLITNERDSLDIIMEQSKRADGITRGALQDTDTTKDLTRYNVWRINERTSTWTSGRTSGTTRAHTA